MDMAKALKQGRLPRKALDSTLGDLFQLGIGEAVDDASLYCALTVRDKHGFF